MIIARRITVFMFLVATVFLSTFEFSGTAHAYAATTYLQLINETGFDTNRMCLGTENGNTADGTLAVVWACNGNADQQWTIVSSPFQAQVQALGQSPSSYIPQVVINKKSGKCLSIPQQSKDEGINPIIRTCDYYNDLDQTWDWQGHGDATHSYINALSNLCLGVYKGIVKSGAQPIVWACNTNNDQHWYLA